MQLAIVAARILLFSFVSVAALHSYSLNVCHLIPRPPPPTAWPAGMLLDVLLESHITGDFWVMLVHHVATIWLLLFSYTEG